MERVIRLGESTATADLDAVALRHLLALIREDEQRSIPAIAKDPTAIGAIEDRLGGLPTQQLA